MAKKRKQFNQRSSLEKSLNRTLKGFFMRWSCDDPIGDHGTPQSVAIGHTNPVMSLRIKNDNRMWEDLRLVLHTRRCKWRMAIKMEFKDSYGLRYFRETELVAFGALPDMEDSYLGVIESMFSECNIKQYVTTYVLQEIIDGQVIQDGDFT